LLRGAALTLALIAASACARSTARKPGDIEADATAAIRRGELVGAQLVAERALADGSFSPDSTWPWTFRLLRAESLILQLKAKDARPDLIDLIPPASAFDSLRARQKYLQARSEVTEGRLQSALAIIDDGLNLPANKDVRFDLEVLAGQVRLRLGKPDADAILNGVVSQASAQGDHYHQALALNNLGMARFTRSRYDDALPWFEQVLAFQDLDRFSVYAAALSNAGSCYNQLGDFDRGAALQARAIALFERHSATTQYVQALSELGRSLLQRDETAKALPYLQRAFDTAKGAGMAAEAALIAGNLSWALARVGSWDEAERLNAEGIRIKQQLGSGNLEFNSINAARIAEGRGNWAEARTRYENLIRMSPEPGLEWDANAGLARAAIAAGQPRAAVEHYERALDIIERTRSDLLKTDYKLSYLTSLIQFYREYITALIEQKSIEHALEIADSSRARVLAERQRTSSPSRVSAQTFRTTLRESGSIAFFYWLQPTTSWLWVVTSGEIHLLELPSSDRIASLVRDYQSTIASTVADPLGAGRTAGDELYATLVEPATRWVPRDAKILIVPDGALHGLNFETLPVADPHRHYWIEDVELQTIPSLGLLTRQNDDRRSSPSLLLIGSPSAVDPKFPALRFASSEMTKVAAHFNPGAVVSYTGPRASPGAYRSASPERFSMIHFAAHAAANVESPLDSAVILAADGGAYKLYARDIAAREQPLTADLVTISACRGAGERAYSGEGLVGFAWAFLRAGARRVIAGLWDVDDESTADLMDSLYAGLAHGQPPAQALRNAKLAMLRRDGSLARPYYWGPFELFTITP
jgi:CHAT domain-containing protein/tetratricopeptide (TPR) repeat protein